MTRVILSVTVSDLVDALSAPIQFMSQAEKRAKQMQEMGIDASDITDVPSSASKNTQPAKKTPTATNGRLVATTAHTTQQASAQASSTQNVSNIEKKKGKSVTVYRSSLLRATSDR
jgi:NMD protein affecting ribosome stability and mRNA decay